MEQQKRIKRWLLLFLVFVLGLTGTELRSTVMMAGEKIKDENALPAEASLYLEQAQQLQALGLFKGTDKGLQLEVEPTRLEGVVVLLRLMGYEQQALTYDTSRLSFEDVPDWGKPYVAFAYDKGLTKGVSATKFNPDGQLTANAFLTYSLRALGYRDEAVNSNTGQVVTPDFTWSSASVFAVVHYLIDGEYLSILEERPFFRADMAKIAHACLTRPIKGSETRLIDDLIGRQVVTQETAIGLGLIDQPFKESDEKANQPKETDLPTINSGDKYPLLAEPTATKTQMLQWAKDKKMDLEGQLLVDLYYDICLKKGLNPVIQFAQMCHETGYLYKVSSQAGLNRSFHNPCGLKVTQGGDGMVAESHKVFKDWPEGIEAHTDHSALYAGAVGYPKETTPDPRHFSFLFGTATYLSDLSGKWAPSATYHQKILVFVKEIEAIEE